MLDESCGTIVFYVGGSAVQLRSYLRIPRQEIREVTQLHEAQTRYGQYQPVICVETTQGEWNIDLDVMELDDKLAINQNARDIMEDLLNIDGVDVDVTWVFSRTVKQWVRHMGRPTKEMLEWK